MSRELRAYFERAGVILPLGAPQRPLPPAEQVLTFALCVSALERNRERLKLSASQIAQIADLLGPIIAPISEESETRS